MHARHIEVWIIGVINAINAELKARVKGSKASFEEFENISEEL